MIDITKATKAVLRHASQDDGRQNLETVHFGLLNMQVATNGHTLAMLATKPTDPAQFPTWEGFLAVADERPITLPVNDVTDIVKAIPATNIPICEHALESIGRNGTVAIGVATHMARHKTSTSPRTFNVIASADQFPDVTQVIPADEQTPHHIGIDPAYLISVGQSMLDVGAKAVEVQHGHATSAMRFIGRSTPNGEQLVIIVMPMTL